MQRSIRKTRAMLRQIPSKVPETRTPIPVQLVGKRFPITMQPRTAVELRLSLENLVLFLEATDRKSEEILKMCSETSVETSRIIGSRSRKD